MYLCLCKAGAFIPFAKHVGQEQFSFDILFAERLSCSQKILPHSVSFHPNTFNFILQLDNGATQILFTLHCFTLLPENTSPLGFLSPAHPNTAPPTQIHFTLQLDNGHHQVDTSPTKKSQKFSMYFQLSTHRSQILTKLNTVKPSSIVAKT